jgi:hypothetical protein
LYIIFGTPGAVYSGDFIMDSTHVFYTGLGQSTQELALYILPMLKFRELIMLENFITGKAWQGGIEQNSAAIPFHTFLVLSVLGNEEVSTLFLPTLESLCICS